MTGASPGLTRLNALPPAAAEERLLACCGSPAWARAVAAVRPFPEEAALTAAAEAALAALTWADVTEALAAHPRLGHRPQGGSREAAWSRAEQAGAAGASPETLERLRQANLAYEERFGHVFLICATGLSAADMLAALRERLRNDHATEQRAVRAELAKITRLRLAKLLTKPPGP